MNLSRRKAQIAKGLLDDVWEVLEQMIDVETLIFRNPWAVRDELHRVNTRIKRIMRLARGEKLNGICMLALGLKFLLRLVEYIADIQDELESAVEQGGEELPPEIEVKKHVKRELIYHVQKLKWLLGDIMNALGYVYAGSSGEDQVEPPAWALEEMAD